MLLEGVCFEIKIFVEILIDYDCLIYNTKCQCNNYCLHDLKFINILFCIICLFAAIVLHNFNKQFFS